MTVALLNKQLFEKNINSYCLIYAITEIELSNPSSSFCPPGTAYKLELLIEPNSHGKWEVLL